MPEPESSFRQNGAQPFKNLQPNIQAAINVIRTGRSKRRRTTQIGVNLPKQEPKLSDVLSLNGDGSRKDTTNATIPREPSSKTSDRVQEQRQRNTETPTNFDVPWNKKRKVISTPAQVSERQINPLQARRQALLSTRKNLPIWSHKSEIQHALQTRDVLLLVGETGSGKSTQVPQFLLDEKWTQPQQALIPGKKNTTRIGGCIAVTEPRRVAAVNLARRVAEEVGTPLGKNSPLSEVGYNVRFDNSTGPKTRIKYLTEGMLLQEMLRDPYLRQYSAVVVDEVHERGVNVDLVLGFLKKLVVDRDGLEEGRAGIPLKLIVMSATAEVEKLASFFGKKKLANAIHALTNGTKTLHAPRAENIAGSNGVSLYLDGAVDLKISHATSHQQQNDTASPQSDSGSEWSGISSSEDESQQLADGSHVIEEAKIPSGTKKSTAAQSLAGLHENSNTAIERCLTNGITKSMPLDTTESDPSNLSICHIEGRQYGVDIYYTPTGVNDIVDAALRTIFQIHHKEALPGDILVFLTGQDVVESLCKMVEDYTAGLAPDVPKLMVVPLFAALSQAAQQAVFLPAPRNTRKVILATNIAETSITVSGVRFVIDSGKSKQKHFRSSIGIDSLLVKPISKSSAIQRKGRAGREAPGQCYRLYTEDLYLSLDDATTPEILRCDLSQAILTMKARGICDISSFPLLSSPPHDAMEKAMLLLLRLGALDADTGDITQLGKSMSRLPLPVQLSRALLAAGSPSPESDCTPEVVDIIACLVAENIFVQTNSEDSKKEADEARTSMFRREGDHLTLLATIRGYLAEGTDRKTWCKRHWISHRAMKAALDVRKQLRSLLELSSEDDVTLNGYDDVEEEQLRFTTPADLATNSEAATPEMADTKSSSSPAILRAFLTGFALNTARLTPDGSYRTIIGNQTVAIHPSSVLFGRRVECIMYNEFVFTNKAYARNVSAVQMDWVAEALM